jgi:hypothetical protein
MKQTWKRNNNQRQEETLALLASLGLTDLSNHFTQRRGRKDWTWSMKNKEVIRVRSVCDYIIAEKRSEFKSFQAKQPRYDGDHRLIKATLSIQQEEEHRKDVKTRERFPIKIDIEKQSVTDMMLMEL